MEKNILDALANDLAILSGFFNVIGDGLSLYSSVLSKQNNVVPNDLSGNEDEYKNAKKE